MIRKLHLPCLLFAVIICAFPFSGHVQNLPPLTITIMDSSATAGYYFLSPYTNSSSVPYDRSHLILDRFGQIVFYQILTGINQNPTIDFKLQPDGRMSYFNIDRKKSFFLDSTFTVVDSICCINYETDPHDLQVLPNNHYLILGAETRIMNLSSYHWFGFNHNLPGSAYAEVSGVVIQEFDENKSLVWEWKGHDHYQFGDVDQRWLFNPNKVDWTHANAVELDWDGNILVSLRHFNEITKIDHETGNIIWRLGGKQNQFTFTNDSVRFTGQHDIRRVSNSSISLMDNGQYTDPPMCRGLEYSLDESNKTATMVWNYVYDSSMYSVACGNHQYVGNGNHLIDFGFCAGFNPWMVIVKPDQTEVLEMSFPSEYISYRAFNHVELPWKFHRPAVECQKINDIYYLVAEPGHPEYRWSTGETTSSIPITATGEYWVFVPLGVGYLSSERMTISDLANPCLFTGINAMNIPDETTLRCSPVPASEEVTIRFDLPEDSRVVLTLIHATGTPERHIQGNYPSGTHEIKMNVSSLARGAYIIRMMTNHALLTKKLVIQ